MNADEMIHTIKGALEAFDVKPFMSRKRELDILEASVSQKKDNVEECLQGPLNEKLKEVFNASFPTLEWETEYPINDCGDSVDIHTSDSKDWEIIIEIDATRADQVAKKFVSRFAHILESSEENVIYVVLCYPGTDRMPLPECEKYIDYGEKILKKIHQKAHFISAMIENDKIVVKKIS